MLLVGQLNSKQVIAHIFFKLLFDFVSINIYNYKKNVKMSIVSMNPAKHVNLYC